jgi:tRNA(Ile)-lysidine synthase TilS/MesJ
MKVALLFSGGLDSCFLALMLKKLNVKFKCYTASLKHSTFQESHDELGLKKQLKHLDLI